MLTIIVMLSFFGSVVVGSLIASALRTLPSADQLEEEDRLRFARYERAL